MAEESEGTPVTDERARFCIIGAGPAGLAMAQAFRAVGVPYDHFERHSRVGGLWDIDNPGSPMYESAHFISSKTMSHLGGFPMPDEYPDYPSHQQVLAYLQAFAREHQLEAAVQFDTDVLSVEPTQGSALVRFRDRMGQHQRARYRGVVCASGTNWHPVLPDIPGTFLGEQRHVLSYRSPHELSGKRVLVVGLGNSGADIACDAARAAERTYVSVRRGYHFVPKHLFGKPADVFAHDGPELPLWLERPIFSWLLRLIVGDTTRLGMPKPDHQVLDSHPLMNDQLLHHLRHGDVRIVSDVASFAGPSVLLTDGTSLEVDLVLFATGYSREIAYLNPDHLDGGSWAGGQFLTAFSRKFDSLFTLGFAEINGALNPHLTRLAALTAQVAQAQLVRPELAERFYSYARTVRFDLTGGRSLIASRRHAHYSDEKALETATRKTFRKMGWACPKA